MYKLYSILLDHIFHNLKFFLRRRNFFILYLYKSILVLDKKFKPKIFKVRNYYDYITVREIFLLECYKLDHLIKYNEIMLYYNNIVQKNKIPLIIDCGANIGASSYYFLQNFKKTKIVSIEPDKKNFELLNFNLKDKEIELFEKAISSENSTFEISKSSEDPRAFRAIESKEGIINSITVDEILNNFNPEIYEPFIMKIDIEGGEKDLFKKNIEWVNKFKIIIIEPHDWMYPKSYTFHNFLQTISKLKREFIILNENIVSIRND
tara:strand:- start:164 stop:955 length:792 start_codon:yes stop_codon:yes gene_type:complete